MEKKKDSSSILEIKNLFESVRCCYYYYIPGNSWVEGRVDGALLLIKVTKEEDFSGGQLLNVILIGI